MHQKSKLRHCIIKNLFKEFSLNAYGITTVHIVLWPRYYPNHSHRLQVVGPSSVDADNINNGFHTIK